MNKLRTPFIKPRKQGGTFYTFPSALEDIGININETRNKVALSHYMLLNIPAFTSTSMKTNLTYTDTNTYPYPGDYIFAESLQNYAFNFETMVRNQSTYNFSLSATVSERAFWKWMQKTGMLKLTTSTANSSYYVEAADSSTYERVCMCIGQISSGAQRSDDSGIYNETFVQIPSSYGKETIFFKPYEDGNYNSKKYTNSNWSDTHLQNVGSDEYTSSGILNATNISAYAIFDSAADKSYTVDSSTDSAIAVLNIDELSTLHNKSSYDEIAINSGGGDFDFNAILIYYSIYDNDSGKILSTNAYGLLVLENSELSDSEYKFKCLNKVQSSTQATGTSFSFRLNIKTTSVYNVSDITIEDRSTAAYSMSTDFNDVIKNLNSAINTLRSNTNLIYNINESHKNIKELAATAISKVDDLETVVTSLSKNLLDVPNKSNSGGLESESGLDTILDNIYVNYDNGNYSIYVDKNNSISDSSTKNMYNALLDSNGELNFYNVLALILAKMKS